MKKILYLAAIIIIGSIILSACARGAASIGGSVPDLLQKEWKHSYEESSGNIEIYRPSDYKTFAPSHFRQVYSFKNNGQCDYLVLHPADAHYMTNGTYTYNPDSKIVMVKAKDGKQVVQFEVLELGADIMKIQIVR